MTKKNNSKTVPTAKSRKGFKFFSMLKQGTVAPWIREEKYSTEPWVWHGSDNLYPDHVRTLVDNCGPLERSATMLSEFVAGEGVIFYRKLADGKIEEVPEAQTKFQEWMKDTTEEQFLAQTAYDIAHGLGMTWVARRSATGEVVRLDHKDRFGVRSGKIVDTTVTDAEGNKQKVKRVVEYFYSSDWKIATKDPTDERYKPVSIPAFNWSGTGKRYAEELIFERQYRPREPYYGRMFWLGCWKAAQTWTTVDDYNLNQINCGFSPAVLLGMRFDGTEAEQDTYIQNVQNTFTGSNGNPLMPFLMGLDETEPFVQVLERGNHAGELDEMRSGCADTIYDTFGIPSLLLRDREAGLTSQERAIQMRLQQMTRTLIKTLQRLMTRRLTALMNLEGIEVWDTQIKQLEIFDVVFSDATMEAVQSVDEVRKKLSMDPWPDEEYGKKSIALAKVPPQLEETGPDGKPLKPGDKKKPVKPEKTQEE